MLRMKCFLNNFREILNCFLIKNVTIQQKDDKPELVELTNITKGVFFDSKTKVNIKFNCDDQKEEFE